MRLKVERSAEALRDLEGLIDFIRGRSVEVAARFVDAAEETFRFLAENREAGQLCHFADPRLAGMRVWRMEHFRNHLVYFRPTNDGVEIIRVLHGARDVEAVFSDLG
jgi:toxin ParE1/3/4